MSTEPTSYEALLDLYAKATHPEIVRYEIDENGVAWLYGAEGWVGMTSQKGLNYILDNQPK